MDPQNASGEHRDRAGVEKTKPRARFGRKSQGRYELVIVGSGRAAICASREAARLGVRAALVVEEPWAYRRESDAWFLRQVLRRIAGLAHQLVAGPFHTDPPLAIGWPDFAAVMAWVRATREQIAAGPLIPCDKELPHPRDARQLPQAGAEVLTGQAVFTGRDTLEVDTRQLRFRRAIVATGARQMKTEIEGGEQIECLTSKTLVELSELPQRLAVIGTGPVSCQLAQSFCRLGSRVYLIGPSANILPGVEPEAAAVVQSRLVKEAVCLKLGCEHLAVEQTGNLLTVVIGREGRKEKLFVDKVLLEERAEPNTAGLGLETAGVAYTDRGVVISDRLQTTNRRIFAAGAICGNEFSSLEAAEATARLALDNCLQRNRRKLNRRLLCRCVYTEPEIAQFGLSPTEASAEGNEIQTYRAELGQTVAAVLPGGEDGFAVVHLRRRTGRVVGATIVSEEAGALISPLALLASRNLPLAALADVIPCRAGRFDLLRRMAECHAARTSPPRGLALKLHAWWNK